MQLLPLFLNPRRLRPVTGSCAAQLRFSTAYSHYISAAVGVKTSGPFRALNKSFHQLYRNTYLLSDSSSSLKASVWNLLSHMYKEVLMGLKGSKSMLTFFSLPSSVRMVPVYTTRPFGGSCHRHERIQ